MANIYDNEEFFQSYAEMTRSREGLSGAGEWHQFREMFPHLWDRHVLDLGCGYGWHCKYAADHGASKVLGIDESPRMLEEANKRNSHPAVSYELCRLEDYAYPPNTWNLVISNLSLHYIEDLDAVFQKVYHTLKYGGVFLMNIEHPTFTAGVHQDWIYGEDGRPLYWPVDDYFKPGPRSTRFLGQTVQKQHHTLSQILGGLLAAEFSITDVQEAMPSPEALQQFPEMKDELRRPMMLMVAARKDFMAM